MVNTNSVLSSILFSQTIDWNIKQFFSSTSINSSFELKRIGKAITRRKDQMVVEDDKRYKRITIKTNCGGVFVRDEVLGKDIKTKKQYYVKAGQLNRLARHQDLCYVRKKGLQTEEMILAILIYSAVQHFVYKRAIYGLRYLYQ